MYFEPPGYQASKPSPYQNTQLPTNKRIRMLSSSKLLLTFLQQSLGFPIHQYEEKWLILRVGVQRSIITEALSQFSGMLQKDLAIGRPGKHRLQASFIKSAHSLLVCQDSLFHIRSNGRQEMAVHRSILIKMEQEGETVCRPIKKNNRGCINTAISQNVGIIE